MGTRATIAIRQHSYYLNVSVSHDGYPSHMLKVLQGLSDDEILRAQDIGHIDENGVIYPHEDRFAPTKTWCPDHNLSDFVYARDEKGVFVLV